MTDTRENKKIVDEFIQRLFSHGDLAAVDKYLTDDFVVHNAPFGTTADKEEIRGAAATFLAAFPDWRSELHLLIAEDDLVAEVFTAGGTHSGELMGVAPTGRSVSLPGINVFRLRDGRISEFWPRLDELGLMRQLGRAERRGVTRSCAPRHTVESMHAAAGRLARRLVDSSAAGADSEALRAELLDGLQELVPFDAAFCSAADPATLLFTGATLREIPSEEAQRFLRNEFLETDVNKFRSIAGARTPVDSLDHVTDGDRGSSVRYREIMAPLGFGDEMRAAFRAGGECWGFLCLHRDGGPSGFTRDEARIVAVFRAMSVKHSAGAW